ncbi:hypothetical protein J6590_001093 [Homalodisca vitripennis]|nr:hypothetical protein J6590_001093 [Homalodisca vitripennis]
MKQLGSLGQRTSGVFEPLYVCKMGRWANDPLHKLHFFQEGRWANDQWSNRAVTSYYGVAVIFKRQFFDLSMGQRDLEIHFFKVTHVVTSCNQHKQSRRQKVTSNLKTLKVCEQLVELRLSNLERSGNQFRRVKPEHEVLRGCGFPHSTQRSVSSVNGTGSGIGLSELNRARSCTPLTSPHAMSNHVSITLSELNSARSCTPLTSPHAMSNHVSITLSELNSARSCTPLTSPHAMSNRMSITLSELNSARSCRPLTSPHAMPNHVSITLSELNRARSCTPLTSPHAMSNHVSITLSELNSARSCRPLTSPHAMSNQVSITLSELTTRV